MNHLKFLLLLVGVIIFPSSSSAQELVTFNILPKTAFVRVDGQLLDLSQKTSIKLLPGQYVVEVWAPEFEVLKESIQVEAGKPLSVNLGLKTQSSAYKEFSNARTRYNTAVLKRTLKDGTFLFVTGGLTYAALTGRKGKLNELEDLINNRSNAYDLAISPDRIESIASQYNQAVADYEDTQKTHNTIVTVTSVLAVASGVATYFYFKGDGRKKLVKPVFSAENPLAGSSFRKRSYLSPGTTESLFGLTLNF
ncbi:hypothetical protein [Neolewinella agarilytica]|uniref:PEGA domain-containing protein n=1 Tax=Neolewinella agarilytica TaxID=478744 RepID=A0A1H9CET5_9BACT|nr:hypothetical protein [Neolewinella agarilytica]SEP99672.1 hypothetical protein SAMN05444359_104171 [Neolewinella agarilytica]